MAVIDWVACGEMVSEEFAAHRPCSVFGLPAPRPHQSNGSAIDDDGRAGVSTFDVDGQLVSGPEVLAVAIDVSRADVDQSPRLLRVPSVLSSMRAPQERRPTLQIRPAAKSMSEQ
jgi:hypothetical protein